MTNVIIVCPSLWQQLRRDWAARATALRGRVRLEPGGAARKGMWTPYAWLSSGGRKS